jgi:hypothetical protein
VRGNRAAALIAALTLWAGAASAQQGITKADITAVVTAVRAGGCTVPPGQAEALAAAAAVSPEVFDEVLKALGIRGLVQETDDGDPKLSDGMCGIPVSTPRFAAIAALRLNDCAMTEAEAEVLFAPHGLTEEQTMAALQELEAEGSLVRDGSVMRLSEMTCTVQVQAPRIDDPVLARAAMLAIVHQNACVITGIDLEFDLRRDRFYVPTIRSVMEAAVANGEAVVVDPIGTMNWTPEACALGAPVPVVVVSGQEAQDRLNTLDQVALEDVILQAVADMGCVLDLTNEEATMTAFVTAVKGVLSIAPEPDPVLDGPLMKRLGVAFTAVVGLFEVDQSAGTATLVGCGG